MEALSLIAICTRSSLKKTNRIGARGDPYDSPDWSRSSTSNVKLLTTSLAFLSVQKSWIHLTMISGILLCLSLSRSVSSYNIVVRSFEVKQH
jgi:hypothetical protein